jgi:hypothetical protein
LTARAVGRTMLDERRFLSMSSLFGGSHSLFDTVLKFFREDDWKFEQLEGKTILKMGFKGDNGSWRCFAQVREEQRQFVFYSMIDTNCPADKRQSMADFLTRANYGLITGNFEMDFSDGEVRFKTSMDVKENEGSFTVGILKRLVYINVLMTDKYLPGIMGVMYGVLSPTDAIAKVES